MNKMNQIEGQYIDVDNKKIFPPRLYLEQGIIKDIEKIKQAPKRFISPGLVDSHIHIESSMLCPSRFAAEALKHGTIATVSDPHEIANVCGIEGIRFMIEDGKKAPFFFYYGAPSCVPATDFETSGAKLDSQDIQKLLRDDDIHYLSEMMNYPGVIFKDSEVMRKIQYAKDLGKVVDGHAPGLRGDKAKSYIMAGISTDHECYSIEEAREKVRLGMKIIIREGSAAKNYEVLKEIIREYPEQVMFCSDDKHPDDLLKGHMNQLLARALKDGFDFWDLLRAMTVNPNNHYSLTHGLARKGDQANFVIFSDIENFKVEEVYVKGECVMKEKQVHFELEPIEKINNFHSYTISNEDLAYDLKSDKINVIKALDGNLITTSEIFKISGDYRDFVCDIKNDVLKIVVVNRYQKSKPSVAWINGFGLDRGAIASTVAHDSHNIICVGTNDESIVKAVNKLMEMKGGIVANDEIDVHSMPLTVAGLMSTEKAEFVGKAYEFIDKKSKEMGSKLKAPFMTLSFMALLVIPELKLSDMGLFNGIDFKFVRADQDE